MSFRYHTNCVSSTYELVTALVESEREITRRTFLRHVPRSEVGIVFSNYGFEPGYVPPEGDNGRLRREAVLLFPMVSHRVDIHIGGRS